MLFSRSFADRVYTTVATALIVAALGTCNYDNLAIQEEQNPAAIDVLDGDDQRSVVGQALPRPFIVRVSDRAGRPITGKRVVFRLTSGETGSLDPTEVTTDSSGRAATHGILGHTAGPWEVHGEVTTLEGRLLEAILHAFGEPAEPDSLFATAGQDQTGRVGEMLHDSLVVRVVDRFGNPVSGVTVAWQVVGGGSVSSLETSTGATGSTGVERRLGLAAGTQSTITSVEGLHGSPLTFHQVAVVSTPASLTITTQPSSTAVSGQSFRVQPVLVVRDEGQNLVNGIQVAVSIDAGGGTLGGIKQTLTQDGVARFTDLSITGPSGPRTLRLQAGSITTVSSPVLITSTSQAERGEWSAPFDWPVVGVHLHLLRTGQVLSFGLQRTPRVWDLSSGTFTAVPSSSLLFCSGHAFQPDGRLLVTGGHIDANRGLADVNLFDPASRAWTRVTPMAQGRWYPTTITLASGEMVTVGGADSAAATVAVPELWNGSTWRRLSGASLSLPYYPWLFQAPNGKVFYAGRSPTARYLDTRGAGSWSFVARSKYGDRGTGSAVMYEPGKVLIVGGGGGGGASPLPTRSAETIDLNSSSPSWGSTGMMAFARRHLNATLLPTGQVLVTGGTGGPGFNDAAGAVHEAEIWNPTTGTWKTLAANTVDRIYHSAAILLPDGRVLVTGAGESGGGKDEFNAELYSPPYLFGGTRPTLTNAPDALTYGSQFSVVTPDFGSVAKVTIVRLGSVTHAFDQNQRFLSLAFQPKPDGLSVMAPGDGNLAPPGDYMLFLLNRDDVPSVGHFVNIR